MALSHRPPVLLQIALYTDIPEQARVSASEVLDTALAYIAHGFATQQPAMVQRADELLSRVASAAQVGDWAELGWICATAVLCNRATSSVLSVSAADACSCHDSLQPTCSTRAQHTI